MWLISYVLLWVLVIVEGIAIIALLRVFEGLHQRLEEQAEKHGIARLAPGAILTDHEFVTLQARQSRSRICGPEAGCCSSL